MDIFILFVLKKITVVICVVLYPDFTVIIIPFIILGLIVLGEGAEDTSPQKQIKEFGLLM